MQVARAASNVTTSKIDSDGNNYQSASYVPMYLTSSLGSESFDIELLEKCALDRLKLLKVAERARKAAMQGTATDGVNKISSIRSAISDAERLHKLALSRKGNRDSDWETQVKMDEASHFLLRLALCSKHDQRSWLLATEVDLFSSRLTGTGVPFALRMIERVNGPKVTEVSGDELRLYRLELESVARGPNRQRENLVYKYYKVAFEEVPSLVRHRRVFLRDGFAFVPAHNVMDIVISQFRTRLSAALTAASKVRSIADDDPRMKSILNTIEWHYTAPDDAGRTLDAVAAIDRISLREVHSSVDVMPLCMRHMFLKLLENHHLRHAARMQLGVFLKGCGLNMEESLKFWKVEFGKGNISGEKFDKEYAYNIRHHYGKEGKRRNLMPFPCIRIINERPGPGEHNGCPYREFQEGRLKQALRGMGVDDNISKGIAKTAQEGNFQLACGYCFAATQPGPHGITDQGLPEYIPNHPNEYFIEARRRRMGPQSQEIADAPIAVDDDLDEGELISALERVEAAGAAGAAETVEIAEAAKAAEAATGAFNGGAEDGAHVGADIKGNEDTKGKDAGGNSARLEGVTAKFADVSSEAGNVKNGQQLEGNTQEVKCEENLVQKDVTVEKKDEEADNRCQMDIDVADEICQDERR